MSVERELSGLGARAGDTAPAPDMVTLVEQARALIDGLDRPLRHVVLGLGDTELEIEWSETGVGTAYPVDPATPAGTTVPPPPRYVTAPAVGRFHASPEPGAAPFVRAGQPVEPGTVVGLMETMRIRTAVAAELAGTVTRMLVADAQLVEYGQPLVEIEPAVPLAEVR